jgi:hypothetical protein
MREDTMRPSVLLSFQTALLGGITPQLRGVTVDWDDRRIEGVFVFESREAGEAIVHEVEEHVLRIFPHHSVSLRSLTWQPSRALDPTALREWVYRRKE